MPASLAVPAPTPEFSAPLASGADTRVNRSNSGSSRTANGSRPVAIAGAGFTQAADTAVPGSAQTMHALPNVLPNVALNPESRSDLPAWAPQSGRGEGNPNPFQAMDAAHMLNAATSASVWTARGAGIPGALPASGGSQLQVGYQDPVLGYVELHAHSDGNGVHASLGTQSEAGRTALSGDLSDLAAWMDVRHTPVESLSVTTLHTTSSSFAGGRSGPEEFSSGQSTANGGGSDLASRSGAEMSSGSGSGPGSGHSGGGTQFGPDAASELSIGQRSGFGPDTSPSMEDAGNGREAGFARDDGFAIGASISILA